MKDVIIIGAWPAGLTAALKASDLGKETLILESDSQVGGISKTVYRDGYGFRFEVINFDYRKNSHILFHLSSLLAITSWLTNSNYMYRLILLAWAIPFLAELYIQNKQRVGLMTSLLFVGMCLFPISLSPFRNVLLAVCFSMLLGLFIKTLWSSLEFKKRSNPSTLDM